MKANTERLFVEALDALENGKKQIGIRVGDEWLVPLCAITKKGNLLCARIANPDYKGGARPRTYIFDPDQLTAIAYD